MAQAASNNTTNRTCFPTSVARIHLSHLFHDPFVAAAFKAAEDDGLAPAMVSIDRPAGLGGGASETVLEIVKI
jgi:hypothetical protein